MGTHPIFESDFDCLTEMQSVRHQVLREYRKIYRAIKRATPDDLHATLTLQGNSRDEFRKNASLTDSAEIEKQIHSPKTSNSSSPTTWRSLSNTSRTSTKAIFGPNWSGWMTQIDPREEIRQDRDANCRPSSSRGENGNAFPSKIN